MGIRYEGGGCPVSRPHPPAGDLISKTQKTGSPPFIKGDQIMLNIVVGIILLVAAVFLTVAILMQEGKNSRLSGAIAGGSDNFSRQK